MRYSGTCVTQRPIRVMAIMEADFVTGPAKNLLEFGKRASEHIDLSVVAYLRGGQDETPFIKAARDAGLRVDIIHEEGRFDRSVSKKIWELMNRHQPDVIQTHNTKSHFFLRLSGIWREHTWLAFHHGYTATDLKMRLYNQADRWSLRKARHLLTVCGPFADQLERIGIRRDSITIQHNSVKAPVPAHEAEVEDIRERLRVPKGTPILVSIGRLSLEKGHFDLVQAVDRLRENEDFHLVIVGEGPERARLENELRKRKLQRHVTLAGLQHNVGPYYALADVVVIPSHSEGSPNVLLEAMIYERPIVATRVGGIPEIATHEETALLVPASHEGEMAAALARILKDRDLGRRLAARSRTLAETSYSPDAYCRSMVEMYKRLTGISEGA
jgi:glycosyltransferase involved in cell wall biosynthesis